MGLIYRNIKENEKLTPKKMKEIFGFDEVTLEHFIKDLLSRRIIKLINKNDDSEYAEIEINKYDDTDYTKSDKRYCFTFVGIIIYNETIIYVFPKYFQDTTRIAEFKQVIRVIEKYSLIEKKQDVRNINLFIDIEDKEKGNVLPIMLYLLEDYAQNGAYTESEKTYDINGNGEINWQKTTDDFDPVISNNKPYYFEYYTRKTVNDQNNFFRRIHEHVVYECSKQFEESRLSSFFNLPIIDCINDDDPKFDDKIYIIERLESKLSETFDDRKIMLLKALIGFYKGSKSIVGNNVGLQLIGTRSFNLIWEKVIAKVFGDQKDEPLKNINTKVQYGKIKNFLNLDDNNPTLVKLIKKPKWYLAEQEKGVEADETFKPDFLRINQEKTDEYAFYILDAKYYCPEWESDSIKYQPGVEDVAKQYLYNLAYIDIIDKYKINKKDIKNYFIMPKCNGDKKIKGHVEFELLKKLNNHELSDIQVRMIDPKILFDAYLKNEIIDIKYLDFPENPVITVQEKAVGATKAAADKE